MSDCIFCKIINKEIPADFLYEDDKVVAFLDIAPASPKGGHTLVVPREHAKLITDLSDESLEATTKVVKKLSKAIMKFGDGLNILQNNKKVAGQFVPHVHFHLIPRLDEDGIEIEKWEPRNYKDGEMEEVFNKIKSLLND